MNTTANYGLKKPEETDLNDPQKMVHRLTASSNCSS